MGIPVAGSRITRIVQKNQGGSEIVIATLNYDSAKFLTSVKDAAGRTYTLGYNDGKLVSISRDGTVIAKYGMCKEDSTAPDTRMRYVYDAEAQYGVQFQYKDGQFGCSGNHRSQLLTCFRHQQWEP